VIPVISRVGYQEGSWGGGEGGKILLKSLKKVLRQKTSLTAVQGKGESTVVQKTCKWESSVKALYGRMNQQKGGGSLPYLLQALSIGVKKKASP